MFNENPRSDPKFEQIRGYYSELFRDPYVLPKLGYTPRQIELLKPGINLLNDDLAEVVRGSDLDPLSNLIEEGGKSNPYSFYRFPYWAIRGTKEGNWGYKVALMNPQDGVYELHAHETDSALVRQMLDSDLTSDEDRIIMQGIAEKPDLKELLAVAPTALGSNYIARICLLRENEVPADLNKVVKLIHETDTKDSPLEKQGWMRGLNRLLFPSSFSAVWIEEGISYAAKLKHGEKRSYEVWQKLDPIKDGKTKLIPFGRKANYSKDQVKRILQAAS